MLLTSLIASPGKINKYSKDPKNTQKCHKLFAVGLHQARDARNPLSVWMTDVKTSYPPTVLEPYTLATEKYLLGQILARIALGLKAEQPLPEVPKATDGSARQFGLEFYALKYAKNLTCRQNLLRLVTMKFLVPCPLDRPEYELLMVWPSSWTDEKFFQFLIRFYEVSKTRRNEAEKQCARFQQEVIPNGWFNREILGEIAYQLVLDSIIRNDTSFGGVATDQDWQMVERKIESKGLMGLYWQFRNREAHAFESEVTFTAVGVLPEQFVNFWRRKFPLMFLAAYLIGINMNLHYNPSFNEFYKGPKQIYSTFKNRSCSGFKLEEIK